MKKYTQNILKYLAPASLFAIILVLATLAMQQSSVGASPPPPEIPGFSDKITHDTLVMDERPAREPLSLNAAQEEWVTIFEADFEDENWEQQWWNLSQGGDGYKFGTRAIPNTEDPLSTRVAWAVGGSPGAEPPLDPATAGYPINVNSWLIAGPFDFSGVATINLSFDYFFDADNGDTFTVHAATNLPDFSGQEKNGGEGVWTPLVVDFSDFAGEPEVYIAFTFKSDDFPNSGQKLGLLLDNVKIDVRGASKAYMPYISYDVTPTPDMTPTPTVSPGEDYYKGFTNNIDGWKAVRWSDDADYDLSHSDSCDGKRCGYLNLKVNKSNQYTIVSPKVNVKPYPYTVETKAKIRSERVDGDSYGIVFGASTNGNSCPGENFTNCFEHYYEMRVRYRESGDDTYLQFKLVSVDGHDANNQPIETELIGWKKVSQDPDVLAEWDVEVRRNGDIIVKVSDDEVGRANDSKYINNPFFGLIVNSGANSSAEVKFDYFEVK